jgi:TetR/AcrR family transcriptional regulator
MSNAHVAPKGDRRRQILEALARELEAHPGDHITTAALAKAVGVSEAALYRHFPSKARMIEELIAFAEEAVFGYIHRAAAEQPQAPDRCEQMVFALLSFSERNPGITRILIGDALTGENERLRDRGAQFFERLETELRQWLRAVVLTESPRLRVAVPAAASLLMAFATGRMAEFVRSGFRSAPTAYWPEIWPALSAALFE